MTRYIELTAVEPEFSTCEYLGGGAVAINIELARVSIDGNPAVAKVKINLLHSDVGNLTIGLRDILETEKSRIQAEQERLS